MKLNIYKQGTTYYIATQEYDYYESFRDIHANLYLHIYSEDFQKIMFNNFNAFCNEVIGTGARYYFPKKEDAEKALEWINARLVLAKLSGVHFI